VPWNRGENMNQVCSKRQRENHEQKSQEPLRVVSWNTQATSKI
jgi:hypothetical protein